MRNLTVYNLPHAPVIKNSPTRLQLTSPRTGLPTCTVGETRLLHCTVGDRQEHHSTLELYVLVVFFIPYFLLCAGPRL